MIWAVVPVKPLAQAKTRLAGVLRPEERALVCQAMLADVLEALCGASRLACVVVVTADRVIAAQARAQGAEVFPEGRLGEQMPVGQNAALEAAAVFCQSQGARGLLVVSADVPLVEAETVDALICQGVGGKRAWQLLLAPSSEGTGTNALFQRPPGVMPFLFGPGSLQRHQRAARERGIPVALFRARELALDVDTPADLRALLRLPIRVRTQAVLHEMGVLGRFTQTSV